MTVRRSALVGLLLLGFLLVAAGSALAVVRSVDASYPPGPHAVLGTLSEQTIVDGGLVVISGDGFRGGSLLRVTVDGEPHSTVRATSTGGFQVSVRLTGTGTRLLAVSGVEPDGRQRVVSDPVTVLTAEQLRAVRHAPFPAPCPHRRKPR